MESTTSHKRVILSPNHPSSMAPTTIIKNTEATFMCYLDIEEWQRVRLEYNFPPDIDGNMMTNIVEILHNQSRAYSNNYKALNSIICTLSQNKFRKVSSCTTTKEKLEMLEKIFTMHGGTSQVIKAKVSML